VNLGKVGVENERNDGMKERYETEGRRRPGSQEGQEGQAGQEETNRQILQQPIVYSPRILARTKVFLGQASRWGKLT
jgi:hypothetical protein